ncbi:hypothetical protein AVEN_203812-1 [Araneus ventricosus]|uniref:Uncharacterized protein n=1 Tax=Araneus ventricosus TaxID=182803 RepID=A0A4Y2GQK0_ARAVE|nr:hypothetical protein AVEN_203812-1 [Araneus ventricosus]
MNRWSKGFLLHSENRVLLLQQCQIGGILRLSELIRVPISSDNRDSTAIDPMNPILPQTSPFDRGRIPVVSVFWLLWQSGGNSLVITEFSIIRDDYGPNQLG